VRSFTYDQPAYRVIFGVGTLGRLRIVSDALATKEAARGLYDLEVSIGAPTSLREIGMPADQLDRAARIVTEHPYYNPRPVEYAAIRQLLQNAYWGDWGKRSDQSSILNPHQMGIEDWSDSLPVFKSDPIAAPADRHCPHK
jgi:hypothetical protein